MYHACSHGCGGKVEYVGTCCKTCGEMLDEERRHRKPGPEDDGVISFMDRSSFKMTYDPVRIKEIFLENCETFRLRPTDLGRVLKVGKNLHKIMGMSCWTRDGNSYHDIVTVVGDDRTLGMNPAFFLREVVRADLPKEMKGHFKG